MAGNNFPTYLVAIQCKMTAPCYKQNYCGNIGLDIDPVICSVGEPGNATFYV